MLRSLMFYSALCSTAIAHPSTLPHDHPHGSSMFPHLPLLLTGFAVLLVVLLITVAMSRR